MNPDQFADRIISRYEILVKKATNSAYDYKDDPLNVHKYEKYLADVQDLRNIIDYAKAFKFPDFGLNLMNSTYDNIQDIVNGPE